ncbi:MAG: alcohol dehydrogenase [Saprospiraceae bacterium]|nr:MAG: alcohol dehydrogenase [Saprospiraceae bacterium]
MDSSKMKAIVCTKYGSPDVLQLQEVDKPIPEDNEVLIKIKATTVTAADSMMRRADPFISRFFLGFMRPKNAITGTGFAGEIVSIGKKVKQFKIGDSVFGETGTNFGANAEYVTMSEEGVLLKKPASLSYEEAAPITDGALTSLNFLQEMAKTQSGQSVLIIGASGSLGTAAVQLAKHFGAEVTGVCSTTNLELVKSLGADKVIDYTQVDFTQNGQTYDIIYDTVGKHSFSHCKTSLTQQGIYLSPVLGFSLLFQMIWTSIFGSKKAMFSATGLRPAAELRKLLKELKSLFLTGQMKSVIDKCYPLEQVAEAHRYVDTGHKKGNVVIAVH